MSWLNCSSFVSHQNTYNYSLSAIDYSNYIDNIQGQTRTQNFENYHCHFKQKNFFYRYCSCPTYCTPIHMVIIDSYPKQIQFGEERIQFILVTYTTRVVTKMVTLIICFVWFYNVVKHGNRTDFVLKLLFGTSF